MLSVRALLTLLEERLLLFPALKLLFQAFNFLSSMVLVISIHENTNPLCLDLTAVPIVDQEWKVVGNLSASDCRGLHDGNLKSLLSNVLDFLKEHQGAVATPVKCSEKATIGECSLSMKTAGIHRVWVVNSSEQPIGSVSQTDVIKAFRNL